jgi:threonine dehydrogenase-like Zn-dependent dehydrogenase
MGADLTIAGGEGSIQKVLEATEGRGADLVIDTTGALVSVADAITMARFGGRLLLFGIITATEGKLPFYQLYFKELAVVNARVAKSEDYPASIELVQRGIVRLQPLISHVMPFGELRSAIDLLSSDSGARMKIILEHQ